MSTHLITYNGEGFIRRDYTCMVFPEEVEASQSSCAASVPNESNTTRSKQSSPQKFAVFPSLLSSLFTFLL